MTKISAMYKWSGGTDYRYVCKECKNCIKTKKAYKCRLYDESDNHETDWKPSYIACKAFDQPPHGKTIFQMGYAGIKEKEIEIEGQMSLFDYPEVMP